MINDVGCHKLLFVSNCFVSLKLWLLGSRNVHVLFCSVVLLKQKNKKTKKQQNNYLCPGGDERAGVFRCWWQQEFAIFTEQLIPSLDELCCQRQKNKKQKHCSCCRCRGLKSCASINSTQRTSPAQHLPLLTQCTYTFIFSSNLFHLTFHGNAMSILQNVWLLLKGTNYQQNITAVTFCHCRDTNTILYHNRLIAPVASATCQKFWFCVSFVIIGLLEELVMWLKKKKLSMPITPF